jgi:hypothetical protein
MIFHLFFLDLEICNFPKLIQYLLQVFDMETQTKQFSKKKPVKEKRVLMEHKLF